MSCTSDGFCATFDSTTHAVIYQNSRWGSPTPLKGGGGASLSCTAADFCTAFLYDEAYFETFNGSTWIERANPFLASGTTLVSCASASFCEAEVNAALWYGSPSDGSWSARYNPSGGPFFYAMSCARQSFCAAIDSTGTFYVNHGSGWTASSTMLGSSVASLSCSSPSFCMAMTYTNTYVYNGSRWTLLVQKGGESVSCVSAGFCAADILEYGLETYSNGTWSKPAGDANAVSCASPNFCMAVGAGHATNI